MCHHPPQMGAAIRQTPRPFASACQDRRPGEIAHSWLQSRIPGATEPASLADVAGIQAVIPEGAQMSDEEQYVPRRGDMVIFDRPPPEGGRHGVFQVASHDAQSGMTTFVRLPRGPVGA
jgi:hypothetical protein